MDYKINKIQQYYIAKQDNKNFFKNIENLGPKDLKEIVINSFRDIFYLLIGNKDFYNKCTILKFFIIFKSSKNLTFQK